MNSKSRILFLYKYLYNHTDDEHDLTTHDLLRILDENGFQANRATLRKDIDLLIDSGYDIIAEKQGKYNAYHYGAREFDYIQLQMLVDAVSSATPLAVLKSGKTVNITQMFLGTSNAVIGSSILALLIGGLTLWAMDIIHGEI